MNTNTNLITFDDIKNSKCVKFTHKFEGVFIGSSVKINDRHFFLPESEIRNGEEKFPSFIEFHEVVRKHHSFLCKTYRKFKWESVLIINNKDFSIITENMDYIHKIDARRNSEQLLHVNEIETVKKEIAVFKNNDDFISQTSWTRNGWTVRLRTSLEADGRYRMCTVSVTKDDGKPIVVDRWIFKKSGEFYSYEKRGYFVENIGIHKISPKEIIISLNGEGKSKYYAVSKKGGGK